MPSKEQIKNKYRLLMRGNSKKFLPLGVPLLARFPSLGFLSLQVVVDHSFSWCYRPSLIKQNIGVIRLKQIKSNRLIHH